MRTIPNRPTVWLAAFGALLLVGADALAGPIPIPRAAPRLGGGGGAWVNVIGRAIGRFLLDDPGLLWYLLALAIIVGLGYLGWIAGEELAARAKRSPWPLPVPPRGAPPAADDPNRPPGACPRCWSRQRIDGAACGSCGYVTQ
jgi:hypothetical protein